MAATASRQDQGPAAGPLVGTWLSAGRHRTYLEAGGGSEQAALDLYEWNASVSAAFLHDLAHVEVTLRNAYDRALAVPGSGGHWSEDPDGTFPPLLRTKREIDPTTGRRGRVRVDVNARLRASVVRARRDAGGAGADPGRVVAQLMLGFWRYLTSTSHDSTVWRTRLFRAFPAGTRRQEVDAYVGDLHELRNRAAHHEPVLAWDLAASYQHAVRLTGLVAAPEVRDHLVATSRVPALLEQRPSPAGHGTG